MPAPSGSDPSEGWQEVLDDLKARRRESRAMGGEERLAKHRGAGSSPLGSGSPTLSMKDRSGR
jgi:hypothetical protein